MMAGVVILDILLDYCESASWAIFGAILFFLFLYGDLASGAVFKHHFALMGYASFAFWGAMRIQDATPTQIKPLMIALVVSLAYLGFYLPVAGCYSLLNSFLSAWPTWLFASSRFFMHS